MGSSPSKAAGDEALLLCKGRIRHIKRAIDSRDALSAAHLSYTQSLRSMGTALRRFAELEISPESSLSISEVDKSPSHSSYASPSPSRAVENIGSPAHRRSAQTPPSSKVHYMKAAGTAPLTITIDPSAAEFASLESPLSNFVPLPPPPPPDLCSSWDFFDPVDAAGSGTSNNESELSLNFNRLKAVRQLREAEVVPLIEEEAKNSDRMHAELPVDNEVPRQGPGLKQSDTIKVNRPVGASAETATSEPVAAKTEEDEMEKELCTEDPSEFITHRAKDFLSSMKDIEGRFIRAAEAGNEVSRMLETKKIRLDICAKKPGSPVKLPSARFASAFHRVCCNREILLNQETAQHVSKVITWKRSVSSLSSSSRSPFTTSMIKDDAGDSSSDFVEQFSMVSGSHSSTLDRLYAWERKLHDEIKQKTNWKILPPIHQRGRTVEIFNSFELVLDPVSGTLDRAFLEKKQELYKKVFPKFYVLGWYSTGSDVQETDMLIHKALMDINESPVYLLLNPAINLSQKDLPVTIYESGFQVMGVGFTGSLASSRPKHGDHRFYMQHEHRIA